MPTRWPAARTRPSRRCKRSTRPMAVATWRATGSSGSTATPTPRCLRRNKYLKKRRQFIGAGLKSRTVCAVRLFYLRRQFPGQHRAERMVAVAAQFPEHRAAQSLRLDVAALLAQRGLVFIADEHLRGRVVQIRRLRGLAPVAPVATAAHVVVAARPFLQQTCVKQMPEGIRGTAVDAPLSAPPHCWYRPSASAPAGQAFQP